MNTETALASCAAINCTLRQTRLSSLHQQVEAPRLQGVNRLPETSSIFISTSLLSEKEYPRKL